MKNIFLLSWISFKGNLRDMTSWGIGFLSLLLLLSTPLFASFSMRQTVPVSVDYALSTISFIGLLLSIFTAVNSMAKDIEKRSIYTIVSLPFSRSEYLLGKFLGAAFFILISLITLSLGALLAVFLNQYLYPYKLNSTLFWTNIFFSLSFIYLKLLIVIAVVFLFSSISTSVFLPLILSFFFYFIGESVEEVKTFIEGAGKGRTNPAIIQMAKLAYYIFPNLESFDLKNQAIYGLPLATSDLFILLLYGISYIGIILILATNIFKRREFV